MNMHSKSVHPCFRVAVLSAAVFACISMPAFAQSDGAPARNPTEQLTDLLKKSREEIKEFDSRAKSQPKDSTPPESDPRLKWSAALWKFREENPGTVEAAAATAESLRLQVQANRITEALARTDALPPDDLAWGELLLVLRDAAERKSDANIFFSRANAQLARTQDKALRARIQFNIGRVHQLAGREAEALAAFQAAVAEGEDLPYARYAAGRIYDLTKLRTGQPAPEFSVVGLSGKTISSASLRGHTAVFVYWASW